MLIEISMEEAKLLVKAIDDRIDGIHNDLDDLHDKFTARELDEERFEEKREFIKNEQALADMRNRLFRYIP